MAMRVLEGYIEADGMVMMHLMMVMLVVRMMTFTGDDGDDESFVLAVFWSGQGC